MLYPSHFEERPPKHNYAEPLIRITPTKDKSGKSIESTVIEWSGSPLVLASATLVEDIITNEAINPKPFKPMKPGTIFNLVSSCKVVIVAEYPAAGVFILSRVDGSPMGWLWAHYLWMQRNLELLYRRFVWILSKVGLADLRDGYLPSWTDVRFLKRFAQRF